MAKKKSAGESKLFAWLGTFFTIIGFLIVFLARRDDKYAMFYAKQGLVLFIAEVIIWVIGMLPLIGMLSWILWILFIVVWIMAWINALSGEMKNTFLIGDFAKKINL